MAQESEPPKASTSALPSPPASPLVPAFASQPTTSPTIFVSYGKRSVKARIDREVPLSEIIRQLALSSQLGIKEPPSLFALREKDTGELVTEDNLGRFLERGQPFTLCSAPNIEAAELVEKLRSHEASVVKLASFSLRTLVKERTFLYEFLARGGLAALQRVIMRCSGNTLGYALLSMQTVMDLEETGWEGLDAGFVGRVVEIIATEPLINITRPATAILRCLTLSPSASVPSASSKSPTPSSGFAAVYGEIQKQPQFMKTVVERLSSDDVPVASLSLALINSLLKNATDMGDGRFGDELEKLQAWKVIGKLLDSFKSGGDPSAVLTFQANLLASLHLSLRTRVDEPHYGHFDEIWDAAGLSDEGDETCRWRRLGFQSESPQYEFEESGLLGLKALARFATDHRSEFAAAIKAQLSRPEDRRCPIATVSSTITLALASHFDITSGISASPTTPAPFLLRFDEAHYLATEFFLRIWLESGAAVGDFERVATLTRSQISAALSGRWGEKAWYEVKQEFLLTEYTTVRDRQMREMEIEDDILSKAPVRNLRGRLYLESYEFVRNQRISCLHEGAWFRTPSFSSHPAASKKSTSSAQRPWRFYRLAANRKALHFVETHERVPIRGGLEDVPERTLITEVIASGSSSANGRTRTFSSSTNGTSTPVSPSYRHSFSSASASTTSTPLSLSLVSADGVVAELVAPDQATYSEWVDGLALLRPEGSVSTKETVELIQGLTEIGVKIKLLDLSGERVEIPGSMAVSAVPRSTDFFFSDSM